MEVIKMSTWLLWFGIVLLLVGGLPAGYAWYGKILGIVKKERAKRIWISGMILVIVGIVLTFAPIILGSLPEETEAQEEIAEAWLPVFWIAIVTMLVGAIPAGMVAQSKILDMVKLETAQKAWKIGYILLVIGAVILLWVMMPGHMLP
jgi:uncharacterized membrane protein